jgi:hypothetical protein
MQEAVHPSAPPHPWTLDDIPYAAIRHDLIVAQDDWFYALAAASFVESLSDLYADNLLVYMQGDAETSAWLREQWEPEEMQHGRALRRYVETVWPEFDWQRAFDGFCADYRPYCKPELLEPTRTLEMMARCVVETGTSGLYGLFAQVAPEPVLRELVAHIRNDEVRHYKYFYHFFLRHQATQAHSRWRLARTVWQRLHEIGAEDAFLAVKHAHQVRHPGQVFERADFERFQQIAGRWARDDYPYEMTVKMLLKPLDFPALLNRLLLPVLVWRARRVVAP